MGARAGAGGDDHVAGVQGAPGRVGCQPAAVRDQPGQPGVGEDREGVPVGVVGEEVGDLVLAGVAPRGGGERGAGEPVVLRWAEQSQRVPAAPPGVADHGGGVHEEVAHAAPGQVPGHRQAGLASAPYNAFPTTDGHVAIHVVTEQHWLNLLQAMGREDLKDDPRFRMHQDRAANMEATEAVVAEWTATQDKASVVAICKRYRIPAAPVRNAIEVMNDPHMHQRGMLERIDHPSLGPIVVPNSPLRLHGAERTRLIPSPRLGEHNQEIYGEWLGLGAEAVEMLKRDGVI